MYLPRSVSVSYRTIPGYLVGVTNPMFEQHTEWWDVLANINTGKVTLSAQLLQQQASPEQQKVATLDNEFMVQVGAVDEFHHSQLVR